MRPVVVSLITDSLAKLGYVIVPEWKFERAVLARHLRRLFALLKIDCVLDVGANEGQYVEFLRSDVGYRGLVLSFEPIPSAVRTLLAKAARDPRWVIEACALGATEGSAMFNVMADSQFSSFLQPDSSVISGFERINRVVERVQVAVGTVDSVVSRLLHERSSQSIYLKLDTQGYDMEVLRGASEHLQSIKALQTEASVQPLYKGMPDYVSVIQSLNAAGFDVSGLFANNPHFPRLIEFDCVMVNRHAIGGKPA